MPTPADNQRLTLSYIAIGSLQNNSRDARVYALREKRRVSKALVSFGPLPILVDPALKVLSGNIWLEASRMAGFSEVPVIVLHHLSMTEADAFMLAQVRLIEKGEWDEQKLGEVLRDLTLQPIDFDVSVTGFDPPEIDLKILALESGDEPEDEAGEPVVAKAAVSRPSDTWLMGAHRLICADALMSESYRQLLMGTAAHIVVTDPPFNLSVEKDLSARGKTKHAEFAMASGEMSEQEFIAFLTSAFRNCAQHSRDGSIHFVAMDWRHIHEISVAGRKVYDSLLNVCVWAKNNGGQGAFYRSQHELFFVFKNGKAAHRNNVRMGIFGRNRSNIWRYPGANTFGRGGEEGALLQMHPTVKPVALIADILLDASDRGDIVLDPFTGSGSGLIAAEKVGRVFRGIEINPGYVDAAVRRWERWTGAEGRLAATGKTFTEVAASRVEGDNAQIC